MVGTHDGSSRLLELCGGLPCPVVVVPQVTLLEPLASLDLKPNGPVRFLFVGRDYRRKGLPEVLEAYRQVVSARVLAELHVVTAPGCPLRQVATQLPGVYWYSNLDEGTLHSLYQDCHVVVVPTYADTYNLVLVEAMAFGCAIISSDLPPLPEIAPHGQVGLLVPRGDVCALTDAMRRLTQDTTFQHQCAMASLKRYQEVYAPDVVIPQLLAAFEQAIALVRIEGCK